MTIRSVIRNFAAPLRRHRFELVYYGKSEHDALWGRACHIDGCYEQLQVIRDRQRLSVYAQVAVNTGEALYREMAESTYLEVDPSARVTDIVALIESIAIPKCVELADQWGAKLVAQTARAKAAAEFYLGLLPKQVENLEVYWQAIKQAATDRQREQAKFSLRTGVLVHAYNGSDEQDLVFWAYQIASYTITMHAESAHAKGFFAAGTDPYKEIDLAWCFQFMVIEIIRRYVPPDNRPGAWHDEG